ncbi:MAG: bifunctional metallophosphatase/5'-nucleotidase [Anaerolineae bacterium]
MAGNPRTPGLLHLIRGRPNPAGGADALYLLSGDATATPVCTIAPAPAVTLPPPPPLSAEHPFRLTVLHFNDLHGRLADVTPASIQPVFSRMAGYFRRVRARCTGRNDAGLLVCAAGDDLEGSIFAEFFGTNPAEFQRHPAYALYSVAGVDVAALGNHDLDWGPGMLARGIRQDAAFPVLAANLAFRRSDLGRPSAYDGGAPFNIYPAALFVVNGLRVGVIGLTTSSEVKQLVPGEFTVADPLQVARCLVPALRPLCDVLIILSHLGQSLDHSTGVVVGAGDVELARELPRGAVHLIVGAHTHSLLNPDGLMADNIVNSIPIVQAGARGHTLGEVHIMVRPTGVAVTDARVHRVDDLPADEQLEVGRVYPLAEQAQAWLAQPIGRVADHPDLDASRVRETFASAESALANFMADALAERCRAAGHPVDFAAVDASLLLAGLPGGRVLTYGDLFRLLPYGDSIVLLRITAAQLLALLDDNARRADRPDEPHTERGFLQFSHELRYRVVLGPERRMAHAADVTLSGVPLAELSATRREPFLVACSHFVRVLALAWERVAAAEGVDLWDWQQLPHWDTGLPVRREVHAFVRSHGGISAEAGLRRDGRLRFS